MGRPRDPGIPEEAPGLSPDAGALPGEGFAWRRLPGAGGGLDVLVCERIPAPHGFAGRFRLRGPGWTADAAAGATFGRRSAASGDLRVIGHAFAADRLLAMLQVHGAEVVDGDRTGPDPECDGIATRRPGSAVVVKTADCVPILLHDPVTGAAAGAHAGWRGTLAGVARAAVARLRAAAGAPPGRLLAAIGPAIGLCCFEVGEEVFDRFPAAARGLGRGPGSNPGKPRLDLAAENRRQLLEAGLLPERTRDAGICTRCDPRFHSHRRDGRAAGRNWSVLRVDDPSRVQSADSGSK